MSLIERIGRARTLPRPAPGRFRPLRAGILGVWEYDDQELWFADGRLVLRGQNTAGKSKALELLLPFVLDGETRPERLDPFGNRSKTMYWNLIDFDPNPERRSALGYCWLEFGRIDDAGEECFVTALVGLRATRSAGRRVETWFAVTPLRVGDELDLAPGGRPITADGLRSALDGRGQVHLAARDHRATLDAELFGLGTDRYDALIHLLLQLRRPKLSEKLDVTKLTDILSDALPPLEAGRLDLLGQAFTRLDADAAELEALVASHDELTGFLDDYGAYARLQVRLRADAVRSATTRLDKVTETERFERQERDDAQQALEGLEERRRQLDALIQRAQGQLRGLDLSKVHALREVERLAEEREDEATRLRVRVGGDRATAEAERDSSERAAEQATAAVVQADTALEETVLAAGPAGLDTVHASHAKQLRADPDTAGAALDAAAQRRVEDLRALRQAAAAASEARRQVEQAEERHCNADAEHDERREEARAAADALDQAAGAYATAVDVWLADLDHDLRSLVRGPTDLVEGLGHEVLAATLAHDAGAEVARSSVADQLAPVAAHVRAGRSANAAERARLVDQREEARRRCGAIEAETDDAPPATPGRPGERPDGCVPLWGCVDFRSELDEVGQAGLEAALDAVGVLDALVTVEGALLDADTLDTVISGAPVEPGLATWLAPVASAPLPIAAVRAALASVGAGPGSGATCWVSHDGRWANGPLHGRWSRPSAAFVGAAARAAARARRLAVLEKQIATLDARLGELAQAAELVDDLEVRAGLAAAGFPAPTDLRDAVHAARRAEAAARTAADRLASATRRLDEIRADAAQHLEELAAAESRTGCCAGDVDSSIDATSDYRRHLVVAVAAVGRAKVATGHASDAFTRAEDARRRATASAEAETGAVGRALSARGEADELKRTVGADVEVVLARQRALEGELETTNDEHRRINGERDEARDRLVRAGTRLQGTEEQRIAREQERAEALVAQARLASTELATLAVGAVDQDRDLAQVTAGLAFARSAFDRLRDLSVDQQAQDAVSNRLYPAFTSLRSRLASDFDPHLDTSDGVLRCVARLGGRLVGAAELERALAEQVERRRQILSAEERELIERHLLAEVGTHLGERAHAAWSLVDRMNDQLAAHPTRSGVWLKLSWEAAPEAGPTASEALKLLRRDITLLTATERATLAAFLAEQVRAGREHGDGADLDERLAAALDYRRWHRFVVHRRGGTSAEQFTARTQAFGSGGEQAKLAHLPLFATMAGYYGSARPTAPRLLVLDEAFAGIDDDQRGDCMAMLVELDLDPVLANFGEWGCYPEVPLIAVYHLERTPGMPGVAALRFVWDGRALREDDPFLDDRSSPDAEGVATLLS